MARNTTSGFDLYFSTKEFRPGISFIHGVQVVAHQLITTYLPLKSLIETSLPSNDLTIRDGKGSSFFMVFSILIIDAILLL